MEDITKKDIVVKSIEELSKEGWEDTYQHFGNSKNFKIYKNGNDRILYNTKEQKIEKRYKFDASKG